MDVEYKNQKISIMCNKKKRTIRKNSSEELLNKYEEEYITGKELIKAVSENIKAFSNKKKKIIKD